MVRVHLPIGIGLAAFIWLCVFFTSRASTMKSVRKRFEVALSALSPSDQEAFVRQEFGRADILNTISLATDEEPVPLGQAVIARLEAHMAAEDDSSVLEKISFDGVPVTGLTQELAAEKYPDWTGNEVMWVHYGLQYKYDLNFDMASGSLSGFTVECVYDVDWNS